MNKGEMLFRAGIHELVVFAAWVVSYLVYVFLLARVRYKRYFAYCVGSRRNVVSKERVSRWEWDNYDSCVQYPVLGITRDTIYFLVDSED